MSDGCPLTLWATINNQYRNNNIALQTTRCDLSKLDIYLCRPGDMVHSIWAHIQALINVLAADTGGHKISKHSCLIILATTLQGISLDFNAQFNALADNTPAENVLHALDHIESSLSVVPSPDTILYTGKRQGA